MSRFSLLSALILAMILSPVQAAMDSQTLFQTYENRVFQIRVVHRETGRKRSIGSGFVFGRSDRLATNYHVVSQFMEKPDVYHLRYLASDGSEGEVRLIAVDAVHDLAVVQATRPLGDPLPLEAPPPKGAALYAMGNPLDLGLTIAAGTNGGVLSQTDESRILFSGSLNPGMSGGPTFDESGAVVGINVATARNDISFIVPSRYLRRLVDDGGYGTSADQVSRQISSYQRAYIGRISSGTWPSTRLRKLQVPGAISPTIRCWDASPKRKPEHLYERYSISCKNENEIFLTDELEVGKIIYEFLWVESEELGPLRFSRLYEALNTSQFSSKASEDDVSRFECATQFVETNGIVFKATLCSRNYKQYTGLSDVLFTAAMIGRPQRGFIFNLDLYGTDQDEALRMIERFLSEISWQD